MSVFGLDLQPLGTGEIPLEAVVIVKTLDADGDTSLSLRSTKGLPTWERAGLLRAAQVIVDTDLAAGFTPTEGEDEE